MNTLFFLKSSSLNTQTGIRCSTCPISNFCLPPSLSDIEISKVDTLIANRKRLKKGDYLYRQNQQFNSIYSVHFGSLKTTYTMHNGRSQVLGFYLPAEMLGLDGIGDRRYHVDAIALEETVVCEIPFESLEGLSRKIPALQNYLHRILSHELMLDQMHLSSLGSLCVNEKLAGFLINLSSKYTLRGCPVNQFEIHISREEIASYLGVRIETISRTLSYFVESGFITLEHRRFIKLIDIEGLLVLAGQVKTKPLYLDKAA